jgi:hypothetical protein
MNIFGQPFNEKIREDYFNKVTLKIPLIHAVINESQKGIVINDDSNKWLLIIHSFGWAQIIGNLTTNDEARISRFLFSEKKVQFDRLGFFSQSDLIFLEEHGLKKRRIRFLVNFENLKNETFAQPGITVKKIDQTNGEKISKKLNLDLFNRNWPSKKACFREAIGFAAFVRSEPIAACYSAAVMGKMHEVDVVTDSAYQRRGIGKIVAARFVKECEKKSLIPSWDCFQENLGSINLAKSVGFTRRETEYSFYFHKKEFCVPTA